MTTELKKTTEQKMQKSLEALKNDLGKIRTGRAHPGILDHVQVDYYGSMVPINQVANVTLIDARTIGVQAWEKPMIGKVEKAIRDADLGLNPAHLGHRRGDASGNKEWAELHLRRLGSNQATQALETLRQRTPRAAFRCGLGRVCERSADRRQGPQQSKCRTAARPGGWRSLSQTWVE